MLILFGSLPLELRSYLPGQAGSDPSHLSVSWHLIYWLPLGDLSASCPLPIGGLGVVCVGPVNAKFGRKNRHTMQYTSPRSCSFGCCMAEGFKWRLPNGSGRTYLFTSVFFYSMWPVVVLVVQVIVVVVDLYSASRSASNELIAPLRRKKMSFQRRSEAVGTPSRVPEWVWKRVPFHRTSNGESPTTKRAATVLWNHQLVMDGQSKI